MLWPRAVLSHRPEGIAKKEGKDSVKFVDGLANVARNGARRRGCARGFLDSVQPGYSRAATDADARCTGSVDPLDLLAEILAMQQSQKRFRHTLDPIEYILFETNFSCSLPFRETPERLISSVPPVKYQKTVDAGARHDELTHEPLANVRFAELSG